MNGSAEPVSRGVAVIVISGALLGFGYNYLGQLSRPARGLAWISEPKQLPSLEAAYPDAMALTGTSSQPAKPALPGVAPSESAPTGTRSATGDSTAKAPPGAGAPTPNETAARTPGSQSTAPTQAAATPGASAAVADPDDPLGLAGPSESGSGLPEIPDLDRPFAVQLATVKRFFDAGAAYIVDARDVEEFEEGHIPGAVNLPYSTAGSDPARLESIDAGERPIIIYCGGGTCEVSMSMAETLVYQFAKRKVLVYMGGFPEWQSAGYPVQTGKGDEVRG